MKETYAETDLLTFGPVPSRRLGRSLGINNIVPKICSYACTYCQLGNTLKMQIEREAFYSIESIVSSVRMRIDASNKRHEAIDYLAFVPDGEPTLDLNLEHAISALRPFGIKIAVISNASLIDRSDVRDALCKSDWVSLKTDTAVESTWHRLDRPSGKLDFHALQNGALAFREVFKGVLATETMLVKGVNDSEYELETTAAWLQRLRPDICYISVPTRPPAQNDVNAPLNETIAKAYHIFKERGLNTELLITYEGDEFAYTESRENDLLGILSVHPMRKEAVVKFLEKSGGNWEEVARLIKDGELKETHYQGHTYYARVLKKPVKSA